MRETTNAARIRARWNEILKLSQTSKSIFDLVKLTGKSIPTLRLDCNNMIKLGYMSVTYRFKKSDLHMYTALIQEVPYTYVPEKPAKVEIQTYGLRKVCFDDKRLAEKVIATTKLATYSRNVWIGSTLGAYTF